LTQNALWFDQVSINDVDKVGGKNASLGEMISNLSALQVSVPNGFATTADAYVQFLSYEGLDERIDQRLNGLDIDDVNALAAAGSDIRQWFLAAPFPAELEADVRVFFSELQDGNKELAVAVRSSATAEDLPDASFAGQQETHLNIVGIDAVFDAMKDVFASLFNDRAIAYREHHGFKHKLLSLSNTKLPTLHFADAVATSFFFFICLQSLLINFI
jgi:pyruvate,water dikinase